MKKERPGKEDQRLVFTHHGQACRVRRSHRRGMHQITSRILVHTEPTFLDRWFRLLLPRLSLGELV